MSVGPEVAALQSRLAAARRRLAHAPHAGIVANPSERYEPFPLSETQEAFWIGRREGVELRTACFVYYELEAPRLDFERFELAWQQLVARHDMLRVEILPDGQQRVRPHIPKDNVSRYQVEPADLEAAIVATREGMIARLKAGLVWPLYEVRLTDAGAMSIIHIGLDVLIGDGHSIHVLLADLASLYADSTTRLAPLGVSYRDYLLHKTALEGEQIDADRAYWAARLMQLPERPKLPLRRSGEASGDFVRYRRHLAAADWSKLKARAQAEGLTPSALLLSHFADVVATWSETNRFTLNVTLFDRQPIHPDVNHLVGDFSSSLLLPCKPDFRLTCGRRAQTLQHELMQGLDHRGFSALRVMRELLRREGGAPRALMPVVFTSHLGELARPGPWPIRYGISQTPQVWLDHQIYEEPSGELVLHWDAPEAIFAPGVLQDMIESSWDWLSRLAHDPTAWIPGNRPRSRASAEGDSWQIQRAPEAILPIWQPFANRAVDSRERVLTTKELQCLSRVFAGALARRGIARGTLVAIIMDRDWRSVVAQCGILMAGAAFLPLDTTLPVARLEAILTDAGVAAVAIGPGTPPAIARRADAIDPAACEGEPAGPVHLSGRDLAYLIYTSGSTGRPKGVLIEHGAAANTITDINSRYAVGPCDALLWVSSAGFDLSVYDIFGALAAGATIVTIPAEDDRDPAVWLQRMAEAKVTVWNSAPQLMEMLLVHLETSGARPPPGLRLVLLSGDWIAVTLPARIQQYFGQAVQIVSLGGATEASIWSLAYEIDGVDPEWRSIPYGRPLRGQFIDVRTAMLEGVPDWVAGELVIGGAGVARGYHGDPQSTAHRFVPCPLTGARLYRTGDLARRRRDGVIELLGRMDRQVKIRGHRIEPGEVETTLLTDSSVAAAAVVPHNGALAAYVVARGAAKIDVQALRGHCSERLGSYMTPATITVLERLPLTANGKLDLAALPPPAACVVRQAFAESDTARRLAALWAEALGVEPTSVHQDFFDAGGNSIIAVRLHARIVEDFGVAMPLRSFFEAATIAGLVQVLHQCAPAAVPPPLVADLVNRYEPFPLTEVQQAYWVGREDGYTLGNIAAHAYAEFEAANLDVPRLERSWNALVERHDMLRASIDPDGYQRVRPQVEPYSIAVADLRPVSPAEQNARLAETREAMSHRVMDATSWPLFEIRVSLLPDRSIIHCGIDLLIADAWSLVLLGDEMRRVYRDPNASLPALGITFRDAVLYDRRATELERGRAEAYWRARLALPAGPALPLRRDPAEIVTPRFVRRSVALAAERWNTFKASCQRRKLTPSAALLTVFASILGDRVAERRFSLNVSLFHRRACHPDIDRIVGDFTSLLLIEMDADPTLSLADRAQATHRALQTSLDHAAWTGVQILRARAAAGLKGMPIVFTSMIGLSRREAEPSQWRQTWGVSQTPQVWIDHQVSEEPDGTLQIHWDAVEDLFAPGLLDEMFASNISLLRDIAEQDSMWERVHGAPQVWPRPEHIPEFEGSPRLLEFKFAHNGLRRFDEDSGLALEIYDPESIAILHGARRSVREYSPKAVGFASLSRLLTALMAVTGPDGLPKRRYGSAGSLYPVRAYVVTRENGVEGLAAGIYYYDPARHHLCGIGTASLAQVEAETQARFAIVLTATLDTIDPVYGERSLDFCRIEAGLIAQTLETEAASCGLGLCQIGAFPFELVGHVFEERELPLHALIGGHIASESFGETATLQAPRARHRTESVIRAPDDLVRQVVRAWAEALEIDDVPLDKTFADLGGSSVRLLRMRNRLSASLGRSLPLRHLLRLGTVEAQAAWLAQVSPAEDVAMARARGARRRRAIQGDTSFSE